MSDSICYGFTWTQTFFGCWVFIKINKQEDYSGPLSVQDNLLCMKFKNNRDIEPCKSEKTKEAKLSAQEAKGRSGAFMPVHGWQQWRKKKKKEKPHVLSAACRKCLRMYGVCTHNHKPQNTHTTHLRWHTAPIADSEWQHHGMLCAADPGPGPGCRSLLGVSRWVRGAALLSVTLHFFMGPFTGPLRSSLTSH